MRQPILLCELLGLWTELRDMLAAHASRVGETTQTVTATSDPQASLTIKENDSRTYSNLGEGPAVMRTTCADLPRRPSELSDPDGSGSGGDAKAPIAGRAQHSYGSTGQFLPGCRLEPRKPDAIKAI